MRTGISNESHHNAIIELMNSTFSKVIKVRVNGIGLKWSSTLNKKNDKNEEKANLSNKSICDSQ